MPIIPGTDCVNSEMASAYRLEPRHALAQYAATGCLGRTFHATREEQLARVLELCAAVEPGFVAKTAVYSRTKSLLKDMPALLCAWLSNRDPKLHEAVFARVIDNTRMLRSYVQILRSGITGRKSLGTAPKRLIREWLARQDEERLFRSGVGQSPSLADVLKMVHPRPDTPVREAFYGYMLGRSFEANALPKLVMQFESFRSGEAVAAPELPFTMLSALPLTSAQWKDIARNAPWQTTRMNLNTFARHSVFEDAEVTRLVAERLRNPGEIAGARVFPYQLLAALKNCSASVPVAVKNALHDAVELAMTGVPAIAGPVVVCLDVSASMLTPVTGHRAGGVTTSVQCVEVAALVAAAVVRKNLCAMVMPFADDVYAVDLDPRDRIIASAAKLTALSGGGTNCSAPLRLLNQRKVRADLVIFVSDNQSWADPRRGVGTAMMAEWAGFRQRNPRARLVCLDVQPNETTQTEEREDVLNIGGFSDSVFEVIRAFASGELEAGHWVSRIEAIGL